MLDYPLLRADDNCLWAGAEKSLQDLVLDEFHTYGGAQGIDVAMLLRRFRARLDPRAPARSDRKDSTG